MPAFLTDLTVCVKQVLDDLTPCVQPGGRNTLVHIVFGFGVFVWMVLFGFFPLIF